MSRSTLKRIPVALCLIIIAGQLGVSVSAQTTPSRGLTSEEILAKSAPFLVWIGGKDQEGQDIRTGTGFFVAKGLVVTSYSLISKAVMIWMEPAQGRAASNVTVTAVNRSRTLALLRAREGPPEPLVIAASPEAVGGGSGYAIAASSTAAPTIVEVRLNRPLDAAQPWLLRLAKDIGQEFNGCPVLSKTGQVIGVAASGSEGTVDQLVSANPVRGLPNLDGFLGEPGPMKPGSAPGGVVEGGVPPASQSTGQADRGQSGSSPAIIRKEGNVMQGQAVRRAEPMYPALARAARVTGVVVVEIMIDEEGNVIGAYALAGHPLLKSPAVAAAFGWLFRPTTLNGTPVMVIGTITFNFQP